jgi:hypothetical protein
MFGPAATEGAIAATRAATNPLGRTGCAASTPSSRDRHCAACAHPPCRDSNATPLPAAHPRAFMLDAQYADRYAATCAKHRASHS